MEKKYELGGGYAWLVWVLASVFVVWLFNVQTGYAILNHDVAKSLNLSLSQVGLVASTYTWVFAIAQLFSGALLDKVGSKKVLVPAIFLVMCGVFIFAHATSFEMLLISQVVLAIGSSAGFVGAGYVGGVWFGMAKFGVMFGYVQTVASLSSAFGQAAFDFALNNMTWQTLMNGFGFFGGLLFILAILFIKNPTKVESDFTPATFVKSVISSIVHLLKMGQIWAIGLQGAIVFGMVLAIGVVWGPKVLIAHGLTIDQANHATACIWLGVAVGSAFINQLSNGMKSRKKPIIVTTLIQLIVMSVVIYTDVTPIIAMVCYFIFGMCNAGHMLNFTAASDIVPVQYIGTSASIVNGAMFVFGGILIGLPGNMLEGTQGTLADFQTAMSSMVIAMAVALVIALFWMKETYKEQQ